ncbi:Oidioi.mRNA.OKI2018_I69.chr2.g5525.t1.cds [Oikopleura dioica]|uniref:Oidioi.mRNA.OKI2018_I69.chr2.g5525.t1.cds n=1 Tax=Oikopleura dioica TaxID=34765 RepID=A0ABN7T686_OIKDI|nr:Oidioi.mRNA.OKI2018_I69.chr2.g5525.t1.cds [Oikopleura dioica]
MSSEDGDKSPVGGRWKEYTQESWTRTSIVGGSGGTGFQQDKRMNDPSMDWMNSKSTRKEFFDNLEQQYTYFCYGKGN